MICSTCPRPCAAQRAAMYDVSASAAAASTHHSPADSCVTMSASRAPTERTTSFWLSASTARTVSVENASPSVHHDLAPEAVSQSVLHTS